MFSLLSEAIINLEEIEMYSRLSYLSPSDEVDTHRLFTILLEILLDHKIKDPYRSMVSTYMAIKHIQPL